ncbi:MAG: TolC family protein, partial [Acidobacteriota bacterium]
MKRKRPGTVEAWSLLKTALVLAILVQGCAAVGPNYEEPVIRTPDAWSQKIEEQVAQGPESTLQSWWKVFEDPTLNDLIERARQQNLDLQMAVSRVQESRAILAISRGEKQPLVDLSAAVSGNKLSDDGVLEQVAPDGGFDAHALFELGVDAFWEIDVFGRIRRTIEAAGAGYEASVEDYRDVLVTLFGEVALAYVDVRSAQQRLEIAHANAASQAESLAMAK